MYDARHILGCEKLKLLSCHFPHLKRSRTTGYDSSFRLVRGAIFITSIVPFPLFAVPLHVRFVLPAFKQIPGVQFPYSHKYITLLFFAHPSALHVVQPSDVVCFIKYAFVRHFLADVHVGMHQRTIMRSIRSNER